MKIFRYILILQIIMIQLGCVSECEEITGTFDNGKKRFVKVYPDCSKRAKFIRLIYFENGQLQNEANYVHNQEHGEFKRWNREGILIERWDIINGNETGHIQCWHDNGKPKKEVFRIDGVEQGPYYEWDIVGKLSIFGQFENGIKTGEWVLYDENGGRIEYTYFNDTLNGKTYELEIDSTDITHVLGQYENGKEYGEWKWFNKDSVLIQTAIYENSKIKDIKTINIETK